MQQENTKAVDQFSMKTGKGFMEGLYFDVNMHIELRDKDGNLKQEEFVHNTVTANGKTGLIAQCTTTPGAATFKAIAIGTGTPGANALGTEIARSTFTSNTSASNVATVVASFAAGVGTGALIEAGVFDNVTASSGNMWMDATFAVINKGANDSLSITWTLQVN